MNAPVTLTERDQIGANNPPPDLTIFNAHDLNIRDWCEEARGWLDGEPIQTPAQAEALETLLDALRKGKAGADEARKVEKAPLDKLIAEIQDRWNPLLKMADTAATACKTVLGVWRDKVAAEKAAEARRVREEADAKIAAAAAASKALDRGNLSAIEDAEALIKDAKAATKLANRTEKAAVTGNGLRTHYTPRLTDGVVAARHYWATNRPACEAFFLSMAKTDVLNGKRTIPGFAIDEDKRAV